MPYESLEELRKSLSGVVEIKDEGVDVTDADALRGEPIDRLVRSAVFGDDDVREAARWIIWSASQALGCGSASIQGLYDAMGRGEVSGFTVPAINLRGLTYDAARTVFSAAEKLGTGPVIFEIARSEVGYTEQRPAEYVSSVLGAALKEGWKLPVMLQGDHFQFKLAKMKKDPAPEVESVKALTREAIAAGFYNIDVDSSTLVDLDKDTLQEQQRANYERCAEITKLIREVQPEGITVSVGGEIGEVGGKNSTVEEFCAFMDGFAETAPDIKGISKISVQTGTSHGGVPLPDGSVAEVKLDFGVLESITKAAREKYGISGAVQHGASTLPDEAFHHFPKTGASEIHLATGFQNIIYDHEKFPSELRDEIYKHLEENHASERKEGQTDEQFIYKTRKKGFGPFKRQVWDLPAEVRAAICEQLQEKFSFLFDQLGTRDTADVLKRHVIPVPVPHPKPDVL
ncbi:MAG: class II fructose-bisphosphate aldolase [Polyangia bacterium]